MARERCLESQLSADIQCLQKYGKTVAQLVEPEVHRPIVPPESIAGAVIGVATIINGAPVFWEKYNNNLGNTIIIRTLNSQDNPIITNNSEVMSNPYQGQKPDFTAMEKIYLAALDVAEERTNSTPNIPDEQLITLAMERVYGADDPLVKALNDAKSPDDAVRAFKGDQRFEVQYLNGSEVQIENVDSGIYIWDQTEDSGGNQVGDDQKSKAFILLPQIDPSTPRYLVGDGQLETWDKLEKAGKAPKTFIYPKAANDSVQPTPKPDNHAQAANQETATEIVQPQAKLESTQRPQSSAREGTRVPAITMTTHTQTIPTAVIESEQTQDPNEHNVTAVTEKNDSTGHVITDPTGTPTTGILASGNKQPSPDDLHTPSPAVTFRPSPSASPTINNPAGGNSTTESLQRSTPESVNPTLVATVPSSPTGTATVISPDQSGSPQPDIEPTVDPTVTTQPTLEPSATATNTRTPTPSPTLIVPSATSTEASPTLTSSPTAVPATPTSTYSPTPKPATSTSTLTPSPTLTPTQIPTAPATATVTLTFTVTEVPLTPTTIKETPPGPEEEEISFLIDKYFRVAPKHLPTKELQIKFVKKVMNLALKLDPKQKYPDLANAILLAIGHESGFNPKVINDQGASGLIQFTRIAEKASGFTIEEIRKMDIFQQLDGPVTNYLMSHGDVFIYEWSPYMSIFCPAAAKHDLKFICYSKELTPGYYIANKWVDLNGDGLILSGEAWSIVQKTERTRYSDPRINPRKKSQARGVDKIQLATIISLN